MQSIIDLCEDVKRKKEDWEKNCKPIDKNRGAEYNTW